MSATEADPTRPILQMQGMTKRFPGVVALDQVDFSARRGEIHSLIGQNGAGKSTLMRILAGVYQADEGQILIDQRPVTIGHPSEALKLGIATVYQELSLLPNLTVADNIFLGREPGDGFRIDEAAIRKGAEKVFDQLGIAQIDIDANVGSLPLAQQQVVEIAKALSYNPPILILDEPTAPLAHEDTGHLFQVLTRLRDQGIAIVFITHRFKEIIEHCDRGTILRNGRVIKTVEIRRTSEKDLVESMIGQEIESFYRHDRRGQEAEGDVVLEVENLSIGARVRNVSFQVRRGEIIGITGLLGAGQNEVARALVGIQKNVSGIIRRNGQPVFITSPKAAIELGICLLTENRKQEGLFLEMNVRENVTISSLSMFLRSKAVPLINAPKERQAAQNFIEKVNVVLHSVSSRISTLSGGNQQKAILARWLLRNLEVLVFIEPTRGIDVGAKAEIYRYLDKLAKEGKSIIVVSPELPEILGISDRVLVMYQGRLAHVVDKAETSEELLLAETQGGSVQ